MPKRPDFDDLRYSGRRQLECRGSVALRNVSLVSGPLTSLFCCCLSTVRSSKGNGLDGDAHSRRRARNAGTDLHHLEGDAVVELRTRCQLTASLAWSGAVWEPRSTATDLAERGDLLIGSGLLRSELVAGKADDDEALVLYASAAGPL